MYQFDWSILWGEGGRLLVQGALVTLELAARRRRVALLIVDEAHTSEADTVRETIPLLDPVCLVGFTATPCRSVPTQTLSLFDRVLVRYTMRQAVAAGDLVDFRHIRILGEELPGPIDEVCLDMMREHCDGFGPGLVSASNIADAEAYAAWLTERGWAALPIHSKLSERQQDANLARLWAGDVRCLVHPALLAEGVDFPALRWLCHRRKVQAGVRFWQETGRPTRADNNPDPRLGPKTHAIILDPHLLLGRHGPMTLEALGQAIEDATDVEEAHPSVERARRTLTEAEAVALDLLHERALAAGTGEFLLVEEREVLLGLDLRVRKQFRKQPVHTEVRLALGAHDERIREPTQVT